MSEANILNALATSVLHPDYGIPEALPDMFARAQMRSGEYYARRTLVRGRYFDLGWIARPRADNDLLRQWAAQYEGGWFTYYDIERARYYSGCFDGPLAHSTDANEQVTAHGRFLELPRKALFAYPTNWARDAIFIEERDDDGNDVPTKTGVWTYAANANAHGGAELTSTNLNTTDKCELVYFGYGFRFWARKDVNLGIGSLAVTSQSTGAVELAATNVDLYAAAPAAAAALFTKSDLPLDLHRVSWTATNTKNAASAAKTLPFDAIEVMR
jgi:hypothetical protein